MEKNKRTTGKAGKLLRKAFPFISEKSAESFAVKFKDLFYTPTQGLIVKTSVEPESFAQVYTMKQAPASDPKLGNGLSSLAASCMRYDFSHLDAHPCSIYGSGDFQMVWIENASGQLMARCVVAIRGGKFAPSNIYTNSDIATKTIQEYLNAESAKAENQNDSWVNCKLLKIESGDGFLAPYLDHYQNAVESSCGNWRLSNNSSEIEFTTTSGESGSPYHCENCDCSIHEEEMCFANDRVFCESCYCDNFTYCDSCEESCENSDIEQVLGTSDTLCQYCAIHDDHILELETAYDGANFAHIDSCVIDSDGYAHHVDSDTWFQSDIDSEIYNSDDLADVPTQNLTQMQALEFYTLTVVKDQNQNRTRVYTLKPWLELDSCGEIIDNQLELEL
tara:strand:+ start:706 stop:1878 length:1173 start_codon:yes stop_codon:yes gene_type:complete